MEKKMTVEEFLDKRIAYAKSRQVFWKNSPDIQQIWKGIESELLQIRRKISNL